LNLTERWAEFDKGRVAHISIWVPHLRDGFIVAKVCHRAKARSAFLKNPHPSEANPEPEGPDFSRAVKSRRKAATALPKAGAKSEGRSD
jgi:hypothetical protein